MKRKPLPIPFKLFFLCIAACFFTGCSLGAANNDETQVEESASVSGILPETDAVSDTEVPSSFSMTVSEKNVTVPNLKRDYTFLYLSDTHMIYLNGDEPEEVTDNAMPRTELFKDSEGIFSYERFPEWMDYANQTAVDMVLLGGDIIDFPSEANLSLLRKNLQTLKMPYVYALGNHDWTYPWDYMTPAGRETYRPLFHEFTKDSPAASVTEYEELVILSVDNSSNQVDSEALSVTDYALELGKPVIVVLHVPFSTESLLETAAGVWNSPVSVGMADKGGIYPDANTLSFQYKILAADSPVICVLGGHVHFTDTSSLTDSIVQIVGDAGYKGIGTLLRILPEN